MQDLKANGRRKIHHRTDHFQMYLRISDYTFFAYLFPAGLKLRFDQTDNFTILGQKLPHRRQYFCQRNKRYVDRHKRSRLTDILRCHIPDICPLHTDHPGIISQFPVQLTVSHINGIHLYRAILQHTVGKTAGRSTHIHADLSFQTQSEMTHGLFKFQSAPADVFQSISPDFNIYRIHKCGSCFIFFLPVYIDDAGHDHGLGLFPGSRQSPVYQQYVQSFFHAFFSCLPR